MALAVLPMSACGSGSKPQVDGKAVAHATFDILNKCTDALVGNRPIDTSAVSLDVDTLIRNFKRGPDAEVKDPSIRIQTIREMLTSSVKVLHTCSTNEEVVVSDRR